MIDRLLRDIGEHGIGAAEGDDRHLGEEDGDLGEDMRRPKGQPEAGDRQQPQREEGGGDLQRPADRRPGMGRDGLAEDAVGIGKAAGRPAMAAAGQKGLKPQPAPDITDEAGAEHDEGERQVEQGERHEGGRRQGQHHAVAQRPPADAHDRFEHDGENRRLQPEEQGLDQADIAEQRIDPAERHDGDEARQHEQRTGDEAALGPVQQPADIDGELLRLRSRQERAIIERMEEPRLADPALFLDDDAVHDGDLASRAAEAEGGDPRPDPDRLAEGDAVRRQVGVPGRTGNGSFSIAHHSCPVGGQRLLQKYR